MFCARAGAASAVSIRAIALRQGSETRMLSIDRRNRGPRVVGAQDAPVVRASTRASDRAPLPHPDTMSIAVAPRHERGNGAVAVLPAVHRKVGAVVKLATGGAQDESNVVLPQRVMPARCANGEGAHAAGRCAALHLDRANGSDSAGRNGRVV